MSDSLRQRVVDRIRQPGFAGKPSAVLGACGKHRSYREHFEDLGKRQELVAIKDELYSRGIKDAVDQGVWKSLKDAADFVPFGHVLLGRRRSQFLVGRLVASPDSVGRSEYPLMLFVLVEGIAPEHVQSFVLPMLAELEATVMAAESLADVTAAIAASRATLTAWSAGEFGPIPNAGHPLARLGTLSTFKTSRIGIINALYQIDRRFKSSRSESRSGVSRGLHLRIPCTPNSSSVEALLWCNVIAAVVNADASATVFCPIDRPWLDLVVGDMNPADFFCLHANEKVLPPVDAIPYQIDPAVVAELTTRIDRPASPSESETVQGDEEVTEKRGWKKWLGLK